MPTRDRRHLRLVGAGFPTPPRAETPDAQQIRLVRAGKHGRDQAAAAMRSRTRDSLNGFGIAEITVLAAGVRAQLDAQAADDRAADDRAGGDGAGSGLTTVEALRAAWDGYTDVLDWLTTNDRCIYHGELR
ncbi:hypothetical protein WHI96_25315 [Pseudonocardia tropica]|uniref:Uncharacterized protein n=1 Tax=Pseudonocardia tropica TaxID=681289 RepID=A0ABV1K3K4_9PSEU